MRLGLWQASLQDSDVPQSVRSTLKPWWWQILRGIFKPTPNDMQQLLIGNLHAEWLMPGPQGGNSQETEMEPQQQFLTEGTYVTGV